MKALRLAPLMLFLGGCSATARSTIEYDPAAQVSMNQWTGIAWTAFLIGAAVCIAVIAIGVTVVERAKAKAKEAKHRAQEARYREER